MLTHNNIKNLPNVKAKAFYQKYYSIWNVIDATRFRNTGVWAIKRTKENKYLYKLGNY